MPMSDLVEEAPYPVKYFSQVEAGAFSAVTVFRGFARLIVYNDAHTPGRRASDITHECSHGLLLHEPMPALDGAGCRNWDRAAEDEAQWLAGALLITEEAALMIARRGMSLAEAALAFGTSEPMVRFRVNVTGARKRIARARRRG